MLRLRDKFYTFLRLTVKFLALFGLTVKPHLDPPDRKIVGSGDEIILIYVVTHGRF